MAAIRYVGFLKTGICNGAYSSEGQCTSLHKISLIGQTIAEILRFFHFFSKWLPSAMHDELLVIFINAQNLVGIDAVVSKICKYRPTIFNVFGLKMPIHGANGVFLDFTP